MSEPSDLIRLLAPAPAPAEGTARPTAQRAAPADGAETSVDGALAAVSAEGAAAWDQPRLTGLGQDFTLDLAAPLAADARPAAAPDVEGAAPAAPRPGRADLAALLTPTPAAAAAPAAATPAATPPPEAALPDPVPETAQDLRVARADQTPIKQGSVPDLGAAKAALSRADPAVLATALQDATTKDQRVQVAKALDLGTLYNTNDRTPQAILGETVAVPAKAPAPTIAAPTTAPFAIPVEGDPSAPEPRLAVEPRAPERSGPVLQAAAISAAPVPVGPAARTLAAAADKIALSGAAMVDIPLDGAGLADLPAPANVSEAAAIRPGTAAAAAPALPTHIVDRIGAQITAQMAPGGAPELTIRLDPPELGQVKIALSGAEGQLVATVTAERADVDALLRRHAAELTAALAEAGYGSVDLSFGSDGQAPDGGEAEPGAAPGRPEVALTAEASAVAAPLSASGLDLRI